MINMKLLLAFGLLIALIDFSQETQVRQCEDSDARQLDTTEVKVAGCEKGTCRLRRKTEAEIEITFTPERDIKSLTTSVNGVIGGIPLPFIGVDGTSACNNVYDEDGKTKVKCPLKAGTKYVYKNKFPVLELYPKINLVVHWSLRSKNEDIVCFEVPAKIV